MHGMVESSGVPRPWRQYVCVKPLDEDAAPAEDHTAVGTPRGKDETNLAARDWQIRKESRISIMDPPRYRAARQDMLVAPAGRMVTSVLSESLTDLIRDNSCERSVSKHEQIAWG
jgi:hypothetical protein